MTTDSTSVYYHSTLWQDTHTEHPSPQPKPHPHPHSHPPLVLQVNPTARQLIRDASSSHSCTCTSANPPTADHHLKTSPCSWSHACKVRTSRTGPSNRWPKLALFLKSRTHSTYTRACEPCHPGLDPPTAGQSSPCSWSHARTVHTLVRVNLAIQDWTLQPLAEARPVPEVTYAQYTHSCVWTLPSRTGPSNRWPKLALFLKSRTHRTHTRACEPCHPGLDPPTAGQSSPCSWSHGRTVHTLGLDPPTAGRSSPCSWSHVRTVHTLVRVNLCQAGLDPACWPSPGNLPPAPGFQTPAVHTPSSVAFATALTWLTWLQATRVQYTLFLRLRHSPDLAVLTSSNPRTVHPLPSPSPQPWPGCPDFKQPAYSTPSSFAFATALTSLTWLQATRVQYTLFLRLRHSPDLSHTREDTGFKICTDVDAGRMHVARSRLGQ